jgi:hypothetical protein
LEGSCWRSVRKLRLYGRAHELAGVDQEDCDGLSAGYASHDEEP